MKTKQESSTASVRHNYAAQWRNDRPVVYGVREATQKIGCTVNTACKAFKILQERGFIVCVNESFFNSKTGSKAREWRLTCR
jgi:DNA-binding transcriptional regulator YhcF (GntR family)